MSLWTRTSFCCVVVTAVFYVNLWYVLSTVSKTSTALPCVSNGSLHIDKEFGRIFLVSKGTYRLTSIDPEAANATTLLVMSDSRGLEVAGYHRLSFQINSRYAALHADMALVFVHTPCLGGKASTHRSLPPKDCVACFHKQYAGRAAPWCKLAALDAVMEAYPMVVHFVYIDSDAFVNTKEPLPSTYFTSSLNVFYNYPWDDTSPGCSGIMFWKAGPEARRILREWWDTPGYNMDHPYEQSVFETSFWERNRASIHVIREITLASEDNQNFQHVASYRSSERESLMKAALQNATAE
jgi:hypothetical protein